MMRDDDEMMRDVYNCLQLFAILHMCKNQAFDEASNALPAQGWVVETGQDYRGLFGCHYFCVLKQTDHDLPDSSTVPGLRLCNC